MFKRRLGRSNLEVSAVGLGCWAIGGPWTFNGEPSGWGRIDDAESIRAIHWALDSGIDFFDTAANYGCGHSERILGRALGGRRSRVILASKFGYVVDEKNKAVTSSNDVVGRIRDECEASLRRLGTDYIDLYQLHVDDFPPEGVGEVSVVLEDLVSQGKIRWYGWSTNNPEGARAIAGGQHCTAIQHTFNMRFARPEMLPVCEEHDLASINRYPLSSGFLTGKYNRHSVFPPDDFRHGISMQDDAAVERFRLIEAVRQAFAGDGRTMAQIALGWIWARSDRTLPIPGFKTVAQVQENVGAMQFGPLNPEQMERIEVIFGRMPSTE